MKDMRQLIESVESYTGENDQGNPLLEGKYGPHGKKVDAAIDKMLSALGDDPTLDEIYAEVNKVANMEDKGFLITKGYTERQALGAVAEKLGLPGLYKENGKGFIVADEKDDAGRYKSAGGGSKQDAEMLAKKGYLSKAKAEKLGVLDLFGLEIGGQSDDAKKDREATKGVQNMADADRKAKRKIERVKELLKKLKADDAEDDIDPLENIQFNFESALGKALWESTVMMEALSQAEQDELRELLKDLEGVKDSVSDEIKAIIDSSAKEFADWEEEQRSKNADDSADDLEGNNDADSKDSGTGEGNVDYASDDEIKKATDNPEDYIANTMPKELEAAGAKGLLKATDRGKKKSASVAAVQKIMTQIGSITKDPVYDITVDGSYGPKSIDAVKAAQTAAGLKVDGDPGANTAAELVKFSKNPTAAGGIADKEVQQDIDRAIELYTKGMSDEAGATQGGATQQNSSIDFRHLISIVEGKVLNEALSDEEKKELDGILARLEPKLNDAEYMASLQQSNKELADKFKAMSDARKKYNDFVAKRQADGEKKRIQDIKDAKDVAQGLYDAMKGGWFGGLGTDEEAVIALLGKLKDGNSFAQVEKLYKMIAQSDLVGDIKGEFSGDDLAQVMDIVNRLNGTKGGDDATMQDIKDKEDVAQGLHDAMKGGMLFGLGTDEQAVFALLGKIKDGNSLAAIEKIYQQKFKTPLIADLKSEFSGSDLQKIIDIVQRFKGEKKATVGDAAAGAAGAAGGDVAAQAQKAVGGVTQAVTGAGANNADF
jgi:peptidoglycan hydrolase-like protein with peptidoglycan-binding domain